MPCRAGRTPVMIVVWDGYVTLGTEPITPAASAPARASESSTGSATPSESARRRSPGHRPSTEISTTRVTAGLGAKLAAGSKNTAVSRILVVMGALWADG
jgi:hypothetical protein